MTRGLAHVPIVGSLATVLVVPTVTGFLLTAVSPPAYADDEASPAALN